MDSKQNHSSGLPFLKMHGLGNDFVIVDARSMADPLYAEMARAIGHRFFGVGFDQLAVLTRSDVADVDVVFWNSDGTQAGACGNASRCIGRLLLDESGKDAVSIRTTRGVLVVQCAGAGLYSVNMGHPQLDWREVPLAQDVDLINLPLDGSPGAAGMGNPHCVFVVPDVAAVDIATLGARYEFDPLFPERTNVEFIQILDRQTIRMRVWERGSFITLACGSGACAVAVVAHRKGLTDRKVEVRLDGGNLMIDWREDGVWMTGPATHVFSGVLSAEFLDQIK